MTSLITRRATLALGVAGAITLALPAWAQSGAGAERSVEIMALGPEDAAVTVVEYASLTCPHCATFHNEVFGKLKANYIETDKIRFEMREVYFDRYGLWAAMVARCGGPERYFGITDRLFTTQSEWSRKEEPTDAISAIFAIGRQAGLDDDTMNACVQDQAWAEALVTEYQKNAEADGVTGTPTLFINGEKSGNMTYEELAEKLDAALGS